MNTLITIKPTARHTQKVLVELDRIQFERLAANLGLFRKEFLESLDRAEKEITQGKIKQLRSLRSLRRS